MKYNIGDKVKVREDLIVGEMYDNVKFSKPMQVYKGYTYTIKEVSPYGDSYCLEEIEGRYLWTDAMLKLVEEEDERTNKELLEQALIILGMTKEELIEEGPYKIVAALVKEIDTKYNELCASCIKVKENTTEEVDDIIESNEFTTEDNESPDIVCCNCEVKDFMIKHSLEAYSCIMVYTLLYLFKNNKLNI